ncbi:hypothetical protein LB507_002695 [Fusarium sp. FIESC RH6]|nr:hypothetical protein LB507_002695 [Fusarium sp. FIESC RH6]
MLATTLEAKAVVHLAIALQQLREDIPALGTLYVYLKVFSADKRLQSVPELGSQLKRAWRAAINLT